MHPFARGMCHGVLLMSALVSVAVLVWPLPNWHDVRMSFGCGYIEGQQAGAVAALGRPIDFHNDTTLGRVCQRYRKAASDSGFFDGEVTK